MTGRSAATSAAASSVTACGSGRHAQPRRRRVVEVVGHVVAHDVDRDLDQHRARAAVPHLREGAPHGVGNRLGQDDLLAPLGDVLEVQERGEVRRDVQELARVAARQHDDRHRVAEGLRHAAERVLRARAVLHGEDADALAGGDAADRVRHVQADPLLADDDRADVVLGGGLDDLVDRVADEELDAFVLEDLRDGGGGFHGWLSSLAPARAGCSAGYHVRRLESRSAVHYARGETPYRTIERAVGCRLHGDDVSGRQRLQLAPGIPLGVQPGVVRGVPVRGEDDEQRGILGDLQARIVVGRELGHEVPEDLVAALEQRGAQPLLERVDQAVEPTRGPVEVGDDEAGGRRDDDPPPPTRGPRATARRSVARSSPVAGAGARLRGLGSWRWSRPDAPARRRRRRSRRDRVAVSSCRRTRGSTGSGRGDRRARTARARACPRPAGTGGSAPRSSG